MTKVIRINSERFVLPEGMSVKDTQALAGFLLTLNSVGNEYDYDSSSYLHYAGSGAQVQLEEVDLMTKAEAEAQSTASRKAYEARRAAEQQAS
jgi:hypothetical protein